MCGYSDIPLKYIYSDSLPSSSYSLTPESALLTLVYLE